MRLVSIVCVWCVCVLALETSHAQEQAPAPPPPEAKKAFADGKAAYERGDYNGALQLFQRAALIAPAPSLYYNIGMAYERLGRFEDSALSFDKYLQLIEQPRDDNERQFQDNLRSRAEANHARARNQVTTPPPQPLVEPQPQQPRYTPYPYYGYNPYGYGYPVPPIPPQTKEQRIATARRHRNNGIALLVVGGVFVVASLPFFAIPTHWSNDTSRDLMYFGAGSLALVGLTLVIPGGVALGHWQHQLNVELRSEDPPVPGTAPMPPPRALLDVAGPQMATAMPGQLIFGTPPIRF